jgi:hypothetical protein
MEKLISELHILLHAVVEDVDLKVWGNHPKYVDDFNKILFELKNHQTTIDIQPVEHVKPGNLAAGFGVGAGMPAEKAKFQELKLNIQKLLSSVQTKSYKIESIPYLENLCTKFHIVSRQLRSRREKRETLKVEDEYDVQDLMHSLLKIYFDDVRPEEWVPSYAGSSSRVDFLLPDEKIVLEVKKTRKGLEDKQVGEQLIIDIDRYVSHPNCQTLICFVYDPEGKISNPRGLENDLMQRDRKINVIVYIRPK